MAAMALAAMVRCGARTSTLAETGLEDAPVDMDGENLIDVRQERGSAPDASEERFQVCTSASAVALTFGYPPVCCCFITERGSTGVNCTGGPPPLDATAQRESCLEEGGFWYSFDDAAE
jgi:hypothetical protein